MRMNPIETQSERKSKSKRLISLIWILVLWGFVRLVAELDGINWLRAFPTGVVIFGLWPATLFLGLAIVVRLSSYQSVFRWAAFVVVLSSFFTVFFFNSQEQAISQIVFQQRALVLLLLIGIAIHWAIKGDE
jgi:hypothetical protein